MAIKRSLRSKFLWLILCIVVALTTVLIFIYINLNRLLTEALKDTFNANILSDVYELKFEDLDVNILTGSVKVFNVEMNALEKPARDYPYINSTFRLRGKKMILKNVDLIRLLTQNKLSLKKIELDQPGIAFKISDTKPVFFPFTQTAAHKPVSSGKKTIESYFLEEFKMVDAYFHVINTAKVREFDIQRINLSLKDILIDRSHDKDIITYKQFDFSIGELTGNLKTKNLRYIQFKNFSVQIDSLRLEETPDTVIYHFADLNTGIKNLDIQTADSIAHLTMESFHLSYKKQSIEFKNLSYQPNISDAAMQKRFPYRKEHFHVAIGSIRILGLNMDSLLYHRSIVINEILLDSVNARIYKDLRKDFPPNHRPEYLGQQIKGIPSPVTIGMIKATNVNLVNTEVKPDGSIGKANINRVELAIENMTSRPGKEKLKIKAEAYIENAAHAHVQIGFDYHQPQFSIAGQIDKFDLTALNTLTNSYAPARIKKGIADEITFSGMVFKNRSTGTMKFLYHDLVIDMELENKAKWKSTFLGFAANTYLNASNPSGNHPERVVQFKVDRDMRKGWMAMLIKSVLDGVKETFIMDKENKKAFREAKSDHKKEEKEKNKKK